MKVLIAWLLVAHFIGDFVLQRDVWAQNTRPAFHSREVWRLVT